MSNNIKLNKDVFNKNSYTKVIDTKFKELGVKTVEEQIQEQPSVQEFFNMYNELFFQINELGPTNSHEFLVKTSGEYINFSAENDIILLLQAEIATLREQLLEAQKQSADFVSSIPELPDIPEPEIPESEPIEIPNPVVETITQPQPAAPPKTISNKQRVIDDFKKYPKSTKNKRAARLNLSKSFIKKIKKENNL
jgi:hypothetical protein